MKVIMWLKAHPIIAFLLGFAVALLVYIAYEHSY